MGRAGSIVCPTCSSSRTKTVSTRNARRTRRRADGSVLRAHSCEACGILFLSVQRPVTADEADDLLVEVAEQLLPPEKRPISAPERIDAEGLSPLAYFREDARRRGLSIREYEDEAGIHLMPAQKEIAANEVSGEIVHLLLSGDSDAGEKIA